MVLSGMVQQLKVKDTAVSGPRSPCKTPKCVNGNFVMK